MVSEQTEKAFGELVNLAMEHMDCSGCPTPWWLKGWLDKHAALAVPQTEGDRDHG